MNIITIIEVLCGIYAVALLAYLAATSWLESWPALLLALAPFAYWLFLPSIVVPLLLALLGRVGVVWYVSIVAALLYLSRFVWPMRRRRTADLSDNPGPLRVVTANLLKTNMRSRDVMDTLRVLDADILALQELKLWHADALADLADRYPHMISHPADDHTGVAILSKLLLEDVRWYRARPEANPTLLARVEADHGAFWLVNMHTRIPQMVRSKLGPLALPVGADTSERTLDIRDLVDLMDTLEGPAMLLGDMNTTPEELDYRLIPDTWTSAFATAGAGMGFSYPIDEPFFGVRLPMPLFQLDHVFLRGNWRVGETRFVDMPGSDHRSLMTEVELV